MFREIKELRIKIDGLSQLVKELKPIKIADSVDMLVEENKYLFEDYNSDEIDKAYNSLILGKAWLGKILGELSENTPYTNDGKRKTVEDIEPTADTHRGITHLTTKGNWNTDYNHIEKVDWLREEIKEINDRVKEQLHFVESERMLLLERVEQHLSEARFWLGFELQRIKE